MATWCPSRSTSPSGRARPRVVGVVGLANALLGLEHRTIAVRHSPHLEGRRAPRLGALRGSPTANQREESDSEQQQETAAGRIGSSFHRAGATGC